MMDSAGERLKKTRLEKGLSLEDVQRKTKIHKDILEALEESRIINKAPIYIKGFFKIYSEFLGLNPEDFISDFRKPEATTEKIKSNQRSILPKPLVKLSIFTPHFNTIKIALVIVSLIILSLLAFKLAKTKKRNITYLENKGKTELVTGKKQLSSDTIRVGIRARQDCWLKTKVDGKVIFVGVLKKGRSESWQANERIEFSLGNAGGIDLEVNGKLISPLGRKGQVIKHILITKEGLQVLR